MARCLLLVLSILFFQFLIVTCLPLVISMYACLPPMLSKRCMHYSVSILHLCSIVCTSKFSSSLQHSQGEVKDLQLLQLRFQLQLPAMTERLNINKIDKSTEEWTCKVQVVDKGHPRTNREGNKKYQLMILQDEKIGKQSTILLTKALNETRVEYICNKLDMIHIYAPAEGGLFVWYKD